MASAAVLASDPDPSGASLAVGWRSDVADGTRAAVVVEGLSRGQLAALESADWPLARWQRFLGVRTDSGDPLDQIGLPAMAGRYRVLSNGVTFEPAFPLRSGLRYRATLRPTDLPASAPPAPDARPRSAVHRVPEAPSGPATRVTRVHPTADRLPENLLKFYLHFSAPMSRGHAYDHLELRDAATGRLVELPFLEIDEELWDPAYLRLTLLLDPGRIKRGVKPLEDIGPALRIGRRYRLIVLPTWLDAEGRPLAAAFEKTFEVGPPDRDPPDPASWSVEAPAAGTTSALRVRFPEPMDHAIVLRAFGVEGPDGTRMDGVAGLEESERCWSFVPTRPWGTGEHRVLVPTGIEDLAGNNVGKPFDVDLFERVDRRVTNAVVNVSFSTR